MSSFWVWNLRFSTRRRTCKKNGRYRTRAEAMAKADAYNRRVVFADMNAYRCPRHERWHIGHASKDRQFRKGGLLS